MPRAAPVVVVGTGLAGLCTALACAPRPVLLLDPATGSASELAQGGVAAALAPGDDAAAHADDTLVAGAGLCDPPRVRQLTASAPWAIAWLAANGVDFDRDGNALALGREGGHGAHRIVHAGGDATGARIMAALVARVRAQARIERRDGLRVDALLLRGGRVAGVRTVSGCGRVDIVESGAVVLATGGLGGLYARSTNPAAHRGSGLALALAAGARLRHLEYVQFHPTALAVAGERLPLVSEALRGAGAVLRDALGRPAMAGIDARGDLAPRDVVARRLWALDREGGAWLDATALPADWTRAFPTVVAACRAHGLDPTVAPVRVTPAAHFHMGGIDVDGFGAASVPGLYAVGEVACSGVHGANRLASNSLLECVVMGHRLGMTLAARAHAHHMERRAGTRVCAAGPALDAPRLAGLRALMWDVAGPVRSTARLTRAAADVDEADDMHAETRVAAALIAAARDNPASAGAHWLAAGPAAESRPYRSSPAGARAVTTAR